MANYLIPAKPALCEIEVKKSRFLGFIAHTPSVKSAKAFVKSLKDEFPDARHHCYGFMAGAPWDSNGYGYSDDNEPSGTAGMPIFSHLKHNNIGEITIVVVRYFGGTKLGTGGLARAYADAAKSVLEKTELKDFVEMDHMKLEVEFSQEAEIRRNIEQVGGSILEAVYESKVTLAIEVPIDCELHLPYSVKPSRSTI